MLEQRLEKRRHLIYNLRITDSKTKQDLGHLADLSGEGLMLVGPDKFDEGVEFDMLMQGPAGDKPSEPLAFNARCMWSRQDINPDFFASGFKVLDADGDYIDSINTLIREYGFRD